jgi:hypothetical protein
VCGREGCVVRGWRRIGEGCEDRNEWMRRGRKLGGRTMDCVQEKVGE